MIAGEGAAGHWQVCLTAFGHLPAPLPAVRLQVHKYARRTPMVDGQAHNRWPAAPLLSTPAAMQRPKSTHLTTFLNAFLDTPMSSKRTPRRALSSASGMRLLALELGAQRPAAGWVWACGCVRAQRGAARAACFRVRGWSTGSGSRGQSCMLRLFHCVPGTRCWARVGGFRTGSKPHKGLPIARLGPDQAGSCQMACLSLLKPDLRNPPVPASTRRCLKWTTPCCRHRRLRHRECSAS
jgi:hypothetical protein